MSENVLGVALTLSVVFVLHPLHRLPMRILQYHQGTQPSCQFRNVKAKSWFCPVITRRPVSPELSLHSGLTHKEPALAQPIRDPGDPSRKRRGSFAYSSLATTSLSSRLSTTTDRGDHGTKSQRPFFCS
ncbi:hypothetical protein K457DRAFT_14363 [Linnemannia elongata AG-77]|uniref:Uncharacterized protein n=1 Tax=Linnemannia elongata AG-77 TaxID=1314771 RepID=A0A197KBG8_9FUNG|nr:hypothetical protein K457DRAFT_14363 [Linnemannia elongata AG-77]